MATTGLAGLDHGETAGTTPVVRGEPEDGGGQRGVCGVGVGVRVGAAGARDGRAVFGAYAAGTSSWRKPGGTDAIAMAGARACGRTQQMARFGIAAGLAGCLEAFSVQNDNLTLPLYMWSMLAFVDV